MEPKKQNDESVTSVDINSYEKISQTLGKSTALQSSWTSYLAVFAAIGTSQRRVFSISALISVIVSCKKQFRNFKQVSTDLTKQKRQPGININSSIIHSELHS